MKRYIVLSVNDNPDYLFHVPLVCWAWRYFGWEPILFYSGPYIRETPHRFGELFNLIENEIGDPEEEQLFYKLNVTGFGSDTIAQVSRLYAACLAFNGDIDGAGAFLMTSDIDMLPLSDYWKPDENKLTVYGRDLTDYHYPICYIGAPVKIWIQVMTITGEWGYDSRNYNAMIKRDLDSLPQAKSNDKTKRWVTDQDLITERINNSSYIPERIDRGTDKRTGYPIGRIDRSHWTLDHKQYIDAHLFHDVHRNEESFKKTLQMLHTVWPKEDFAWWVKYYKEFKKLCQK